MNRKPEIEKVVPTQEAADLLMLDGPTFIRLSKEGWFRPVAEDRWRVVDVAKGYVRYLRDREEFASTQELADELAISDSQIHNLHQRGWLPAPGGTRRVKKWNRVECIKGYLRFLEEQQKAKQSGTAEMRVRDARARDLEVRTAARLRELIPFSDAMAALETVCGLIRTVFGGLPARLSRDLSMQRKAEDVVDECLNQVADGLAKAESALKTGADPTTAASGLFAK